jgi:hypothetical protein
MKRIKYDRRRAVECTIVEKSKSNPGYLKYQVTIQEKDGTVHTQPCYGKDMQDALSRLINTERTVKVEKKMERNPFIFFLIWMSVMIVPVTYGNLHDTPWFILYLFGTFTLIFVIAGWWQSYLEKGR